jgi:hypothetical protein
MTPNGSASSAIPISLLRSTRQDEHLAKTHSANEMGDYQLETLLGIAQERSMPVRALDHHYLEARRLHSQPSRHDVRNIEG